MRDLNRPKLGSKQFLYSSIVPLGYARSPARMMSPSKRSNSRAIGASAGEPHQPVSPNTLMEVDALPGGGITGAEMGGSAAGSVATGGAVAGGTDAIGTVSTDVCGAV